MAKITFKSRTGKDFFEFTERSAIDVRLATDWAIEKFVLIDSEQLDIIKISKLSDVAYLTISSKIFNANISEDIRENNEGIFFGEYFIKSKAIKRNLITLMQTNSERFKNKPVQLLRSTIPIFYAISEVELDKLPYELVVFMVNKVNTFLSSITTAEDNFEIADESLWNQPAGETTYRQLDIVFPGTESGSDSD